MDGAEAVKYGGGHPPGTITNRLMLRFRPIAPKPVSGDSASGHAASEGVSLLVRTKRAKRKYVRVKPKNRDSKGTCSKQGNCDEESRESAAVTLELMPQKADPVKSRESEDGFMIDLNVTENILDNDSSMSYTASKDPVTDGSRTTEMREVESWVVVESVTGANEEEEGLGLTDMARMRNLEADTCPGLISDGENRVLWVNKAYRDMLMSWLGRESGAGSESVQVQLVNELQVVLGSFSCVVRVSYKDGEKWKCRRVLPCDVWRMDFGGLAWRLDLKAALTLCISNSN